MYIVTHNWKFWGLYRVKGRNDESIPGEIWQTLWVTKLPSNRAGSKGLFVCMVNKIIFYANYIHFCNLEFSNSSKPLNVRKYSCLVSQNFHCSLFFWMLLLWAYVSRRFMCFRISLGPCCYSKSYCANSGLHWKQIYELTWSRYRKMT